jgi:ABC-type branched-subunit amino acid transport system ATPase component
MQTDERKVLFSIRGLKQYFPIKSRKKLFVKACDGVTIDIYEGETLGLVGESGCGKTTLGRVVLQLYQQTYGRTMYYGRAIDELAPDYYKETIAKLPAGLRKMRDLEAKRAVVEEELGALSQETSPLKFFEKTEELSQASKLAEDAYLHIVQLIGGFIVAEDLSAVMSAHLKVYNAALARRRVREEMEVLRKHVDHAEFKQKQTGAELQDDASLKVKARRLQAKYDELDGKLKEKEAELAALTVTVGKASRCLHSTIRYMYAAGGNDFYNIPAKDLFKVSLSDLGNPHILSNLGITPDNKTFKDESFARLADLFFYAFAVRIPYLKNHPQIRELRIKDKYLRVLYESCMAEITAGAADYAVVRETFKGNAKIAAQKNTPEPPFNGEWFRRWVYSCGGSLAEITNRNIFLLGCMDALLPLYYAKLTDTLVEITVRYNRVPS